MARGKKTKPSDIYAIMSVMATTYNYDETSRVLKIPKSTIRDVYLKYKDDPKFVELRALKSQDFVEQSSRIIQKALNKLEHTIDDPEKDIPINNLTTAIGTLYDKRALAQGQATANIHNTYEELIKKVADEDEY